MRRGWTHQESQRRLRVRRPGGDATPGGRLEAAYPTMAKLESTAKGSVASFDRRASSTDDHADRQLARFQRGCHGRAPSDRWQDPVRPHKDQNIGYVAEYLTALGIDLKEVRVVGDEERAIVDAAQHHIHVGPVLRIEEPIAADRNPRIGRRASADTRTPCMAPSCRQRAL